MARCNSCGADLPDYYTSCPNCGGTSLSQGAPAAPAYSGYVPVSEQPREITSMGGWFCWLLLCGIIPIIGPIIMMSSAKDPTAKNYAKMTLIMQIIGLVLAFLILFIFASAMMGYVNRSREAGSYYMLLNLL